MGRKDGQTMRVSTTICDKCGIDTEEHSARIRIDAPGGRALEMDLCRNCYARFTSWIEADPEAETRLSHPPTPIPPLDPAVRAKVAEINRKRQESHVHTLRPADYQDNPEDDYTA